MHRYDARLSCLPSGHSVLPLVGFVAMDAPGTVPAPRPAAAGDAAAAAQPVHAATILMCTSALRAIFGARSVEAAMAPVWTKVWDALPTDAWKLENLNPRIQPDSGLHCGYSNTIYLPLPIVRASVEHRVGLEMALRLTDETATLVDLLQAQADVQTAFEVFEAGLSFKNTRLVYFKCGLYLNELLVAVNMTNYIHF